VFVDVDGLKLVNDSSGHDQGDALLAAVGTALRLSLRSYDLVVRYGGDEFVCALPGATADAAKESLSRIRSALDGLMPGATVSAGCAELCPADSLDDVIRRADFDLYLTRSSGRPGPRLSPASQPSSAEGGALACGSCGRPFRSQDSIRLAAGEAPRRADAL
jgi:two-component system cell cycle response regulator